MDDNINISSDADTSETEQIPETETILGSKDTPEGQLEDLETSSKEKEQETENLDIGVSSASFNTEENLRVNDNATSNRMPDRYPENKISRDNDILPGNNDKHNLTTSMDSVQGALCATIDEQQQQIKALNENISEEKKHNKDISDELRRCKDEKLKLEKEIKEIKLTNARITRENDELKTDLQNVKEALSQEKGNRISLDGVLEQLKGSRNELERDNKQLQHKNDYLRKTNEDLQKKLDENIDELFSKHGSNVDFQTQFKHLEESKAKLEKENEDLAFKESTCRRNVEDLTKELKECQVELSRQKDKTSIQTEAIKKLAGDKGNLEAELKRLKGVKTSESQQYLQQIEILKATLNEQQNPAINIELQQLKTQLEQAKHENQILLNSKREHEIKIQTLTTENLKLNKSISTTKTEKDDTQSWYHESQKKLSTANKKIADLENEKKISESQLTRSKNDLKKKEDECKQLNSDKQTWSEKNDRLQREVQRLEHQITEISSNIDSLKEQKENFQTWFHDAEKAKREADAKLTEAKSARDRLILKIKELESNISQKENRIGILTTNITGKDTLHKAQISKLQGEFEDKEKVYKEQFESILANMQELERKRQYQDEDCKQHTEEINKLKQENSVLSGCNEMHSQQIKQAEDEKNFIIGNFENMKEQKEKFQKLYHESDKAQREYSQQLKEAEAFFETQQSKITGLEYEVSTKNGYIVNLQVGIQEREQQQQEIVAKLREEIDRNKVEIEEMTRALIPVLELKEEKDLLDAHLRVTKEELCQTQKSYVSVTDRVTYLVTKLKEERIKCNKYQEQNTKMGRSITLLRDQVANLQSAKESLTNELMRAERRHLGFS